jgi:hypothetical protein
MMTVIVEAPPWSLFECGILHRKARTVLGEHGSRTAFSDSNRGTFGAMISGYSASAPISWVMPG